MTYCDLLLLTGNRKRPAKNLPLHMNEGMTAIHTLSSWKSQCQFVFNENENQRKNTLNCFLKHVIRKS